jgi:uncharacterized protein (TIGR02594 family)
MTGVSEPLWVQRARDLVGLREITGAMHEPKVLQLWRDAKMPYVHDDETAWCAAFVGAMLERSMVTSTRLPNARSYENWGLNVLTDTGPRNLSRIPPGAICVFERPPHAWQGHVAFVVGRTEFGELVCIGGNQSNSVSIASFKETRLIAARWPVEERDNLRMLAPLPLVDGAHLISTNEA